MRANKKSQSEVIITVLIILLVIAAIAIISFFVIKWVKENAKFEGVDLSLSTERAEVVDDLLLNLNIKRQSGDDESKGVLIEIYNEEGKSQMYVYNESFKDLETIAVSIPLRINNPNKIELYPMVLKEEQVITSTQASDVFADEISIKREYFNSHWNFDLTTEDIIGSNEGTAYHTDCAIEGKIDQACSFNGVDSYINLGRPENMSSSFSWSGLIKTNSSDSLRNIYSRGSAVKYSISLNSTGQVQVQYRQDSSFILNLNKSRKIVNDGEWHHIVLVIDHNIKEMSLYIDGLKEDSSSFLLTSPSNPARPAYLGFGFASGENYFSGSIDEVRIYSRALTGEEVKALFLQYFS